MGVHTEGVKGATADIRLFSLLPRRLRRGEIPAYRNVQHNKKELLLGRANGRDNVEVMERASWGAHLRMRKVTGQGRFAACTLLTSLFEWV